MGGSGSSRQALALGEGRPVGMRDVAEMAGVSIATVSRFINDPSTLSTDMRAKVDDAIKQLGYIRHGAARALSMRRSHAIGAIIPTVDNATRAGKVTALQKQCRERGYSVLLALSEYDLGLELQQCRSLVEAGVDGLMLEGGLHDPELYDLLTGRGIAFVNTIVFDPSSPYPNIGFDNRAMARKMAEHLLDLGHTVFGMVSGPRQANDRARARVEGVVQALAERGLELPSERVVERPYRVADGRSGLRELMKCDPRPTAVVCGNDTLAFGAMLEAQAMGFDVPGDVSIAGFDDVDWASQLPPGLTTIALPAPEVGRMAADYLIDTLSGKQLPHATEVPTRLVRRGSTGPAPTA